MASVSTTSSVSKKEVKSTDVAAEPVINLKSGDASEDLKKEVLAVLKAHLNRDSLPKVGETLKKSLDEKIGKGWVVFAGKHFTGVCPYIKGTMLELEADGNIFIIFQTFCPS